MTITEKIAHDMKLAMKTGQKHRLETLRTVRAQLLEKQVEKRPTGGMNNDDEISVLISASKKRKESIEIFQKHGRHDLADQESKELEIIQEYLPKQLTQEEVEIIVKETIASVGATSSKDMGKLMSALMQKLKGMADGKQVQETARKILESKQ